MLSKRREHREALRKLLPSIEKQRNELEWWQKMFDKHSSDSEFIFTSIESDAEAVNIILHNFEEFGKTAHDHGFQLIAKYECDGHKIYVAGVQNEANLKETTKSFDELVERKRQKSMESSVLPSFLSLPQTKYMAALIEKNHESLIHQLQEMKINDDNIVLKNKRLQKKVDEYEIKLKEQQDEIAEYAKKTEDFEERIVEQTKKIEDCEHQLKKMEKEKEQIRKQMLETFLEQKNFEMINNSTVVLDGLGNRLFKKEEGDDDRYEPPLKSINSLERRRKEVFDYIEFIRIKWNKYHSESDIQKNIHNWFYCNWYQFLYKPSEEEKEKSRKMFSKKFKFENTIGTIHFLSIHFSDRTKYFYFAISNYRIVYWNWGLSQQDAYSALYNRLKQQTTWTENSKFATEMEVNDEEFDIFIHTSNKDVFGENEKVVTWIKNNFNLEQQNNRYSGWNYEVIPSLYNLIVNSYDTLLI